MSTTTTTTTMTAEQMRWALNRGYAWADQWGADEGLYFWTRRGLWSLDVMTGFYELQS